MRDFYKGFEKKASKYTVEKLSTDVRDETYERLELARRRGVDKGLPAGALIGSAPGAILGALAAGSMDRNPIAGSMLGGLYGATMGASLGGALGGEKAKKKVLEEMERERLERKGSQKTALMRSYAAGRGPIDPQTGQRRMFRQFAPGTTPEQANKADMAEGAVPAGNM